jgi:spermatogenesis-associated protein 7
MFREEEIRYLNFIKEVTDDIIARGVTTNRVINNIFEYHISKSKNLLRESKMRDLLSTLKKDLGMPSEEGIY